MTFEEAAAVVCRVQYGPAFPLQSPRLLLTPVAHDLCFADVSAVLTAVAVARDRSTGDLLELSRSAQIALPRCDERQLVRAIRTLWHAMVMHEVDEGLLLDGELPFDPHRGEGVDR